PRTFCELHSQRRRGRSGGRTARSRNPARNRPTDFLSILYVAVVRDGSRVRSRLCTTPHPVFRWNFGQRSGVGFPAACLPQDEGRKIENTLTRRFASASQMDREWRSVERIEVRVPF